MERWVDLAPADPLPPRKMPGETDAAFAQRLRAWRVARVTVAFDAGAPGIPPAIPASAQPGAPDLGAFLLPATSGLPPPVLVRPSPLPPPPPRTEFATEPPQTSQVPALVGAPLLPLQDRPARVPAPWAPAARIVRGPGGALAPGLREPFGDAGPERSRPFGFDVVLFDRTWGRPPGWAFPMLEWNEGRFLYEPGASLPRGDPWRQKAAKGVYVQAYQDDEAAPGVWRYRWIEATSDYPDIMHPYRVLGEYGDLFEEKAAKEEYARREAEADAARELAQALAKTTFEARLKRGETDLPAGLTASIPEKYRRMTIQKKYALPPMPLWTRITKKSVEALYKASGLPPPVFPEAALAAANEAFQKRKQERGHVNEEPEDWWRAEERRRQKEREEAEKAGKEAEKAKEDARFAKVPDLENQTLAEAGAALRAVGLSAEAGGDVTAGNVVYWQSPKPGQRVLRGSRVRIQLTSRPKVPAVVGARLDDARRKLSNVGLQSKTRGTVQRKAAEYKVTAQSPAAGTRVTQGATVELTIEEAPPEPPAGGPPGAGAGGQGAGGAADAGGGLVEVPTLRLRSLPEAQARLDARGLRMEVDQILLADANAPAINRQDPPAGTKVKPGTVVRVDVMSTAGPAYDTTPWKTARPQGPASAPGSGPGAGAEGAPAPAALATTEIPEVNGTDYSEAVGRLRQAGLSVHLSEPAQRPEADDEVVAQAPAAGHVVLQGTSVLLSVRPRYAQPSLTLPDVVGLPLERARDRLRDFDVLVVDGGGSEEGALDVQSQDPEGGASVEAGARVLLTVARAADASAERRTDDRVPLPDLVGLTLRTARDILGGSSLLLVVDGPRGDGAVVQGQVPEAGWVHRRTEVTLRTRSAGDTTTEETARTVAVPDLYGEVFAEASRTLRGAGFVPDAPVDVPDAVVVGQQPVGGTLAPVGSRVELELEVEVPDVLGLSRGRALDVLERVGLEGAVTEGPGPGAGRVVVAQDPGGGEFVILASKTGVHLSLGSPEALADSGDENGLADSDRAPCLRLGQVLARGDELVEAALSLSGDLAREDKALYGRLEPIYRLRSEKQAGWDLTHPLHAELALIGEFDPLLLAVPKARAKWGLLEDRVRTAAEAWGAARKQASGRGASRQAAACREAALDAERHLARLELLARACEAARAAVGAFNQAIELKILSAQFRYDLPADAQDILESVVRWAMPLIDFAQKAAAAAGSLFDAAERLPAPVGENAWAGTATALAAWAQAQVEYGERFRDMQTAVERIQADLERKRTVRRFMDDVRGVVQAGLVLTALVFGGAALIQGALRRRAMFRPPKFEIETPRGQGPGGGGHRGGGTGRDSARGRLPPEAETAGTPPPRTPHPPPEAPIPQAEEALPPPLRDLKLRVEVRTTTSQARLPRDVRAGPAPPDALEPLGRPISGDAVQNDMTNEIVVRMQRMGYRDIRVNQAQCRATGAGSPERVGVNRPDIQATDGSGRRVYVEVDSAFSHRGPGHADRILANDPEGIVYLIRLIGG